MPPLTLHEVIRAVEGTLFSPRPLSETDRKQTQIRRVVIDSRSVQNGDLFFAFPGERADGHRFVGQAFQQGAAACVVSHPLSENFSRPLIQVQNSQEALMKLAAFFRKRINAPVIGVTGSSGKSTAKEIAAHLLSQQFPVLKAPESYNNEIGVPLTLLSFQPEHRAVVLEMAMRALGQISVLCEIAKPSLGMITSIGEAHIGLLGSIQNIVDAKGELLESLPVDGIAFLNGEDPWTPALKKKCKGEVRLFGFHPEHWIFASEIEETWAGTRFRLNHQNSSIPVSIPLLGRHNLLNFLGSAAIALSLEVSLEKIAHGASSCPALPGRLRRSESKSGLKILDDTYNANPASVEAAIKTMAGLPVSGRRILVLGDMLELGETSEQAHKTIGREVAHFGFGALFAAGPHSRSAVESAKEAGIPVALHFGDQEELAASLISFLKPEDVLLVKGSRKMGMEKIVEKVTSL